MHYVLDCVFVRFARLLRLIYSLNGAKEGVEMFGSRERGMPVLLIRHKVTNYETWKQVFLDEAGTRQANGARDGRFFRSDADPNEVWVLLEWDDLFRARLFVKSDDLRASIVRAGVADHPNFWFLDESDGC